MQIAANENDFKVVEILLRLGASQEGCSSHALSSGGSIDMMQFLLEKGVDPNSRSGHRRVPVISDFTWCETSEKVNLKLKLLLDYGADPNALWEVKTTYDPSPLFKAAEFNCLGNVKLLLEKGASPLHMVSKINQKTALNYIKDKGTYREMGKKKKYSDELIQILENAEKGAKKNQ